MFETPAPYQEEMEELVEELNAEGVFAIVMNGNKGSGASMTTDNPALLELLPTILEEMAAMMRHQNQISSPSSRH